MLNLPLYSMNPSLRNRFMKKLIRDRVVPIMSASVSWLILGITVSGALSLPNCASSNRARASRFSSEAKMDALAARELGPALEPVLFGHQSL